MLAAQFGRQGVDSPELGELRTSSFFERRRLLFRPVAPRPKQAEAGVQGCRCLFLLVDGGAEEGVHTPGSSRLTSPFSSGLVGSGLGRPRRPILLGGCRRLRQLHRQGDHLLDDDRLDSGSMRPTVVARAVVWSLFGYVQDH